MTDLKKITKRQFDKAYKTYPTNGWISFAFKYFSKETEEKDMIPSNSMIFILLGLFLTGFFATAFNAASVFIGTVTIIYAILLVLLVSYLFSAIKLNNRRLKKVAKLLDITIPEYNALQRKFNP